MQWKTCKANEYISIKGTNSSDRVCKSIPTTTTNPTRTNMQTTTMKNGRRDRSANKLAEDDGGKYQPQLHLHF